MKKYTASTLKDKKNNTAIEKDKPLRLSFSKILKLTVIVFVIVGVLTALGLLFINFEVKGGTEGKIVESVGDSGYDCIIILGAGGRDDGSMSDMLRDRMDTGIRLYFEGAAEKIIVSGDHGTEGYDEVNTMKQLAKLTVSPRPDVNTPSSNTPKSMVSTSGCAFSISSKSKMQ